MGITVSAEADKRWLKANTVIVALFVFYYMLQSGFTAYWGTFYNTYFNTAVIVFLTLYFCFRGLSGTAEIKIALLYAIWYLVSRILNGDVGLNDEYNRVVACFSILLYLSACQLLPREKRLRFLDIVCAVMAVYYTVLALICVYAAVFQTTVMNPFTGFSIADMRASFGNRLFAFEQHPNICGYWFFVVAFMLLYLFFRTKKPVLRVLCILGVPLNYFAVALTDSRNCKLMFAVCFAMFCALLVLRRIPLDKKLRRAAALVLTVLLVAVVAYKGFDAALYCVNRGSAAVFSESASGEDESASASESGSDENASEEAAVEQSTEDTVVYNSRTLFNDSGRSFIWSCVPEVIRRDPLRLLRGSSVFSIMDALNNYVRELLNYPDFGGYAHMHNMPLQILMLTGLPGMLLVLVFVVLIVIRIIKLYFAASECMAVKVLTLPVTGILMYNVVENSLFCDYDICSVMFYFLAGAVIAFSQDIYPLPNTWPKRRAKRSDSAA